MGPGEAVSIEANLSMQRVQKLFPFLIAGLILFFVGYYTFLGVTLKPELLERQLVQRIEKSTGGTLSFDTFTFSFFPFVAPEMEAVELVMPGEEKTVLKAKKVQFVFDFFAFLFRRGSLAKIDIDDASAFLTFSQDSFLTSLRLENAQIRLRSIRPFAPMEIHFESNLEGVEKGLIGDFSIVTDNIDEWNWDSIVFDGNLAVKGPALPEMQKKFRRSFAKYRKGNWSASIQLHKKSGEDNIQISGTTKLDQFVYEVQKEANFLISPPIDASVVWDLDWSPVSEEIFLKKSTLLTPIGNLYSSGRFLLGTGEFRNVVFRISSVVLESIPQYYIPLKDALPFNFGFSGKSDLEMSLDGTLSHLSLHANWDLTESLLAYAHFFSKPKETPMNLVFDFLVKDKSVLTGDFSLKLQNAIMKGTLTDINFETGNAQLNLITNKFELSGWEKLIPPFEPYKIGGELKILANLDGNFQEEQVDTKRMLNVSLKKGSLSRGSGTGVENLEFSFDYGAVALELKQASFEIGSSPVSLELEIYSPFVKPSAKIKVSSPKLNPREVLTSVKNLDAGWIPENLQSEMDHWAESAAIYFPEGYPLEDLVAEVEYKQNRWNIPSLQFESYGGWAKLQGELDFTSKDSPAYLLDLEMDRFSFARFFNRNADEGTKALDGNLYLTATVRGEGPFDEWRDVLQGGGMFAITNGEFHSFDILGRISEINGFEALKDFVPGKTAFDDIRSWFVIEGGKLVTEKLLLFSEDLSVVANGELGLDGVLNYSLDAFLAMPLAERILKPETQRNEIDPNQKFGPIALLLSGELANPNLVPNPALLPKLQEDLQQQKTQKVFRSFLPEDFLFERPTSS